MKIKNRINDINKLINYLEKERLYIRESICTHNRIYKGIWRYKVGQFSEEYICKDCGDLLNTSNLMPDPKLYHTEEMQEEAMIGYLKGEIVKMVTR